MGPPLTRSVLAEGAIGSGTKRQWQRSEDARGDGQYTSRNAGEMSNTPMRSEDSPAKRERRRQQRVTPSALVYLDIGSDNGGIVTDLTDHGARVQVVVALEKKKNFAVRLQLPSSPTPIEVTAEIAWVSESKRQAGLRFVDLSSQQRDQICGWVFSHSSLSDEMSSHGKLASTPDRGEHTAEHTVPQSRRDKWLRLLAESKQADHGTQGPSSKDGQLYAHRENPVTRNSSSGSLTNNPTSNARVPPHANPRSDTSRVETTGLPSRQRSTNESNDSAISEPNVASEDRYRHIRWPTSLAPVSQPYSSQAPPAATPDHASWKPRDSSTDGETNLPLTAVTSGPIHPATNGRRHVRLWLGLASVFILFAGLSFTFGRWAVLQRRGTSPYEMVQALLVKTHGLDAIENSKRPANAKKITRAMPHAHRTKPAQRKLLVQNQNSAPSVSASAPLAVRQNLETSPTVQPSNPSPVNKPTNVSVNVAPARRDVTASAPSPLVIDGHTFGPTDRYNPAHLTYRFDPDYPPTAKQQHIEGTVKLHLNIDANGAVRSVKLLGGPPLLVPAAIAAVENWRYLPALLNGEPVQSEKDVEIDFRLPHWE